MTIKELIMILQAVKKQDSEIFIMQSQYDWGEVLGWWPEPSNPDIIKEIRL
jgi:hypothetical protein